MNSLKSSLLRLALAVCTLSSAACGVGAGDGRGIATASSAQTSAAAETVGFADLIAQDPLRHTYDFNRADFGSVVQEGTVKNAGSHLDYSNYFLGQMAAGIQGRESGLLVDLGSDEELAAKLGVAETVGSGQGFAHLALAEGRFGIAEANAALDQTPDGVGHLPPQLGHVYLARIVDSVSGEEVVAKMLVVYVEDGVELAFEWQKLR